jgi:tRNA (guanine-N7-)-methyltransferase
MQSEDDYGVPIPGAILPPVQWAKTAIKRLPPAGALDFLELFGRSAPVIVDMGCGNGRFTITSALARPELNHLGIDILPMVIRYATRRANQRGLHQVRFAVCGGYEFLERYAAPRSIAELHLYHPQPYRDDARAHLRLITPEFIALAYRAIIEGGLFVVQTDNRAYWKYLSEVLPNFFDVTRQTASWPDSPQGRTRREIYARQHRMEIFRAECRPRAGLTDEEINAMVEELPQPEFVAKKRRRSR